MNQLDKPTKPFLYLAPLRGLTDFTYRNCFARHFSGFDSCIAPFINPQRHSAFKEKHLRDILPENNQGIPIIPQLLHTTPDDFLFLCNRLAELGYKEVNWNLGCPAPMVANKRRGSGFLPYPDEIIALLDTVIPKLPLTLSIKTRLGFNKPEELDVLLPRLNQYPLKEIILHTRLGRQLYTGTTDPDGFKRAKTLTCHKLVYNGDIISLEDFNLLQGSFPETSRWMIGRGAVGDPFLPEKIKTGCLDMDHHKERLFHFHEDLYRSYSERLSGAAHILGRMKQVWQYMIQSFPQSAKQLKAINKAKSLTHYQDRINKLFQIQ